MRMKKLLGIALILLATSVIFGQTARLKGNVLDSSGLIIPGAQIRIYKGDQLVRETAAGSTGDFDIAIDPGDYKVEITAPDFQPYSEMIKVTLTMAPLAVSLKLAQIVQNVNVTEDANKVSVDADSSLNATVLDNSFVQQLPDDSDELTTYLQQIAGTRGDANASSSFFIDGFSGGTLPPKEQIQEIRINNNPYSTEFSGIGFGRVEIITRAGTGIYHGNFNFNFRDDKFNAQIPFTPSKAPFQQRSFNSSVSGPIIRNKLTMTLSGRNIYTDNSDAINAIAPTGVSLVSSVLKPSVSRAVTGRGQLALTKNNTLNFSLNYDWTTRNNQGIGGVNLASLATQRWDSGLDLQIRETAIVTPKLVHETRFLYTLDRFRTTSASQAFAHNVLDAFSDGGAQITSHSSNPYYEFGNLVMYSGTRWTVRSGLQVQYRLNRSSSQSNFTGSCTFSSLADYLTNTPVVCTQTQGNPVLNDAQLQMATFMQNEWKLKRNITFAFGVRYETQTNVSDHNNLDPRVSLAYGIGASTVVRVGAGFFHQRLDQNTFENLIRFDGTRQLQIVVVSPVYDPAHPELVFLGAGVSPPSSIRLPASGLVTPYSGNTSISLERSLPKGMGVTVSWDTIRGVHLYRSRNINAPLPGATICVDGTYNCWRPDPLRGNINQLESTAFSRSNNYSLGFRQTLRNRRNLNLFANYTLGWSHNDTDGSFGNPMNNYNLREDWGRSPQDMRHRFFTGANFLMPGNITVNTNFNFNTGRPYNITTGSDDNHDTVPNDRPSGVARNSATGPRTAALNMNVGKIVRLRRAETSRQAAARPFINSFAPGQRGEGGGGGGFPGAGPQGGGGERGGGERGGGERGGGTFGGQPLGGATYNPTMTFQVNMFNVLNTSQFNNYSGVTTSPFFGRANTARNPRTVELSLRFNF
jgi:hypothetical protein